jgi:predicted RNA binding protein YcfA (HicA-like mRNA interferase family)
VKIPRDVSGQELVKALRKLGYFVVRQRGSHIFLRTQARGGHQVVIPGHTPIVVGTLHDILKAVAEHHQQSLERLIDFLKL